MDLVPTDAEVAEAERIYKTAYDADFGRGYGMRRTLESFLQGRAKPAQEEITDAERPVVLDRGFTYENGVHIPTVLVGFAPNDWESRDKFAAAIHASKGEKT